MIVLYILLSILAFGFLIFIHEGGHYLFARLFHVEIYEFSIGMGPKILTKKSKKTGISYSWRAFPIGGFVSMAGEDDDSDSPDAFNKKPVWQRIIIALAGPAVNVIVGFLVMGILVCTSPAIGGTTVAQFADNSVSEAAGLKVGDEIIEVDGKNVHIADDLYYEILRLGIEPIDITVLRDGEKVTVEDIEFPIMSEKGVAFGDADFRVYAEEKTLPNILHQTFYKCEYTVKMIAESLYDLVSGRYGIEAVSGPVGVTEVMTDAASEGSYSFASIVVIISINLGIMNLLPIPGLDGGRIIFLIIEAIRRKPMNRNAESIINASFLALLLLFMAFISVKDVINLF